MDLNKLSGWTLQLGFLASIAILFLSPPRIEWILLPVTLIALSFGFKVAEEIEVVK